jgi:hypothetical protein
MASRRSGRKYCKKKILIKCEQSQYVYEKKQIIDKMPEKNRTFMFKIRTFTSNRHERCRKPRLGDDNLPVNPCFRCNAGFQPAW